MRRALTFALLAGCSADPARVFEAEVLPAMERSCASSSCHGVAPGAEAAGDVIDRSRLFWDLDEAGRIADPDQARQIALRAVDTTGAPDASRLLRKPLAPAFGGLSHYGGSNWLTPQSPDYLTVWRWIDLESAGGEDPAPLNARERQFAEQVQPALASMGCLSSACHGPTSAVPYRLDPGVGGVIGTAATRVNYDRSLRMLALDGDPRQSRLLRKILPLNAGGMQHKGGNVSFLTKASDPRAQAIVDWACAERLDRVAQGCDPQLTGVVFVRGPIEPSDPFDLDTFVPGTDLHLVALDASMRAGDVRNLTADLHVDDADIRDPSVSPDGQRVLFSMRTQRDLGHRIYVLDLRSTEAEQLTFGPGADRDPTWGPQGQIWFVSTRAHVASDAGTLDADLYTLDLDKGDVTRRSWTPHIERKPHYLDVGPNGGEISFTAVREVFADQARAHPFRFPPGLRVEYHQHFGITPVETLFWDMRELPDGDYATIVGELDGRWQAGRVGIIDRNFGPELPPDAQSQVASLPGYLPPLSRLDPLATTSGVTGAVYRDLAPLPNGELLAAYAPGPFDLDHATEAPDLGIALLTLEHRPDGRVHLSNRVIVLDQAGVPDFDPEPVYVAAPHTTHGPMSWDPSASVGLLRHQGVPMVDGMLQNLPPSGTKESRDDIVAMRIIEALPVSPESYLDASAGPLLPSRVLGEVPLAPDGTFHAQIPAGLAFRMQPLDAAGLAVGEPHNRWLDMHPGQTINQGVSHKGGAYSTLCGPCHGSTDGDPAHALVVPDAMTTASLTLSRYAQQNPRRPLPPVSLGDDTRIEVDFQRDVWPLLRSCAGCHDADADLPLTDDPSGPWTTAYEQLHAGYIGPTARQSQLMETLTGDELDAPGSPIEPNRPHGALTDVDLAQIARWLDLGAPYLGTMETR